MNQRRKEIRNRTGKEREGKGRKTDWRRRLTGPSRVSQPVSPTHTFTNAPDLTTQPDDNLVCCQSQPREGHRILGKGDEKEK